VSLEGQAVEVLRRNDAGDFTRPAPRLYPHQWSWDSAIIAIGLAHLDPGRAARELRSLFAGQWASGKQPHIVFDPAAGPAEYFPDAERWSSSLSPDAPRAVATSGLCQPPVHAIAALRIWRLGRSREFLDWIYPRLLSYHEYLATARDPEECGLVTIYHPWESGMDNSPRWDAALAAIEVGDLPPYRRRDLAHVEDRAQRPTDADYDRYLWLVELLRRAGYDNRAIQAEHPFLVKDVLFSAVLVAANEALLELAEAAGAPDGERIEAWLRRGRHGLAEHFDPELGLCLDDDVRAGRAVRVGTVAGFAPLLAGDAPAAFTGHPDLRWPLPPTTSPSDPAFDRRSYWRGPTWPVVNWLLWGGLMRAGEHARAERLRAAALQQVREAGFSEYFDPFSGDPLGSPDQSWTAAVTIDWLASAR
jgi:glucosylglycerate hydrolase